jgi:hypothetical protein
MMCKFTSMKSSECGPLFRASCIFHLAATVMMMQGGVVGKVMPYDLKDLAGWDGFSVNVSKFKNNFGKSLFHTGIDAHMICSLLYCGYCYDE